MKTLKTVVINKSGTELELKEGNNGVYRKLTTLGNSDGKYVISCDQNATYREYWVGTGLEKGAGSITITSDDCAEYRTISIVNDPADHKKFKLDMINRNVKVTAVVNQTGGDVKLEKDGAEPHVIRKDEKYVIKSDPEEAKNCNYKVTIAEGVSIPISTKEVSKAQIINVNMSGQTGDTVPRKPTLDMVSRGLHVTEVTNKTSGPVKVKHCRGQGGSNDSVDVATLQTNDKYTIQYDPKKGRNYCVEYSCSAAPGASSGSQAPKLKSLDISSKDFAEFERIDVVEDSAGAEARLEKLEPRPEIATSTTSILSRVLRRIIPSWFE